MVTSFSDSLSSYINSCEHVYKNYLSQVTSLNPIGVKGFYESIEDTFTEEKDKCDKIKIWECTDEDIQIANEMKAATQKIINSYHNSIKDLLEMKRLIVEANESVAEDVQTLLTKVHTQINESYSDFLTAQKKYAKAYNITLI